jgi:hypothetical protein
MFGNQLCANLKDAVQGYFYDEAMPDAIRPRLVREVVVLM